MPEKEAPRERGAAASGSVLAGKQERPEDKTTRTAIQGRPLRGWIMPSKGGTFQPLAEFEPGAVEAEFLHVTEGEEVVDIVAWERTKPGVWWLRRDLITHVGEYELDRAWWAEEPARMLATPADFVAAHGHGFVILDWSADVNGIIGKVAAVECATLALYRKLDATLAQQARRHGLTITVRTVA